MLGGVDRIVGMANTLFRRDGDRIQAYLA